MNTTVDNMAMLLTPEAAALRLSIGRSKVYELIASGALPSVKIGGSRRITTTALEVFVEELQDGHREPA